jgi:hypothetical protein
LPGPNSDEPLEDQPRRDLELLLKGATENRLWIKSADGYDVVINLSTVTFCEIVPQEEIDG